MASVDYTWPAIYSFPPFFTLQPADATRAKQLAQWKSLVMGWHLAARRPVMSVRDWPHWENRALSRRLPAEGILAVMAHIVGTGGGEWVDEAQSQCRLFFRSPAEFAAMLRTAARGLLDAQGMQTLWQLCAPGEEGQLPGTEFDGMEPAMMLKVLEVLEGEAQVDLFRTDEDSGAVVPLEQIGVRFK